MTTEQRIAQLIHEQHGIELAKITPEANLHTDLDHDSLDLVETVMAVEEEFGIEIPDSRADKVRTVQDLINIVQESGHASNAA